MDDIEELELNENDQSNKNDSQTRLTSLTDKSKVLSSKRDKRPMKQPSVTTWLSKGKSKENIHEERMTADAIERDTVVDIHHVDISARNEHHSDPLDLVGINYNLNSSLITNSSNSEFYSLGRLY